jgi:hypothetical protein
LLTTKCLCLITRLRGVHLSIKQLAKPRNDPSPPPYTRPSYRQIADDHQGPLENGKITKWFGARTERITVLPLPSYIKLIVVQKLTVS